MAPKYLKGHTYRFCNICQDRHREGRTCPHYNPPQYNQMDKSNKFSSKLCKSLPGQYKPYLKEEFNGSLIKQYLREDTIKKKNQDRKRPIPMDKGLKIGKKIKKEVSSIECPVCLTSKGNYKTLGCKHHICTDCWFEILKSDSLEDNCPLCRSNMYYETWETYLMLDKGLIHREGRSYPLIKVECIPLSNN